MINYVVYSHTDYIDILRVQTGELEGRGNLTLIINNSQDIHNIYSKYNKVLFYDDTKPYATRLLQTLPLIEEDYFIFLHDIDIVLSVDNFIMNEFVEFLRRNNFDRICLQHTYNLESSLVVHYDNELALIKSCSVKDYIYNVNPSIWKKDTLIEIMANFPNETYRSIEFNVQEFCLKYNIFKLHALRPLSCGWFICDKSFKFLHITHLGKLLPLNFESMTPSRQSYVDARDEYMKIYQKYNLQKQ